ncbi:glycine betaine ABC transporter substrate-binding protein [Aminobacter sp. BA135]|uniref:glycine betaine ABC transporter substrate-binding protein n=1 Tax=Aminobacter sp. BA135 TaxID=537596 RepID=UPI003D7B8A29
MDGNGKADLYGCEPGWGCERVIEHQLDAYGLRDTVEEKQGGSILPSFLTRSNASRLASRLYTILGRRCGSLPFSAPARKLSGST